MKKRIALTLLLLFTTLSIFAVSVPIKFTPTDDIRVYDNIGEPIKTDTLRDGYMLVTGATPITFEFQNDTIKVDRGSIFSVMSTNDRKPQFYLIDGNVTVAHKTLSDFELFTPWGKYFVNEPSSFAVFSTDENEIASCTSGTLYNSNALSNILSTIPRGRVKNMVDSDKNSFMLEDAFSLSAPDAYEIAKVKRPTAPSGHIVIATSSFKTPIGSPAYNRADDWMRIVGDYNYFLREFDEADTYRPTQIIVNNGLKVDNFTVGQLPSLDEYVQNKTDGGVKFQMFSLTDTIGDEKNNIRVGQMNTREMFISLNPYVSFANSRIELRLKFGLDPYNGSFALPWDNHNFESASDGISAIAEYINDINIENMLFISRTRDLPLDIRNINLLQHRSDNVKLPLLLDLDFKYALIKVYAEDLNNVSKPNVMRTFDLSIVPSPYVYPFKINIGVIYNRFDERYYKFSEMIFNASLDIPLIKDHFNLGLHLGLPWEWKDQAFSDIWQLGNKDKAFYAGADFTLKFGPWRALIGVDYNQKRVFTGYMNMFSNLLLGKVQGEGVTGLQAVNPYLYTDADFEWAGFALMLSYPIYLGNIRPTIYGDIKNVYKNAIYSLNARLSVFVRPFKTEALKITVEYDTDKIFSDAFADSFDNPLSSSELKVFSNVKQNWVPYFIISSETGPVYLKSTLTFKVDKNDTLEPMLSLLMSIDLGSNFMFNPSYYRERESEIRRRATGWNPRVSIEVTDDMLFSLDTTNQTVLRNNVRIKPIIGVDHPDFSLAVQYEFSSLNFKNVEDIASWGPGKYFDTFLNELRIYSILNISRSDAYSIKRNSLNSYSPILTSLQFDLNLFNVFGIYSRNFALNLDDMAKKSKMLPLELFLGYKSEKVSAYIASPLLASWDKSDSNVNPMEIDFFPTFNFDMNIKGARFGVFIGTSMKIFQDVIDDNKLKATFGLGNGNFKNWDMLFGATLGYESEVFDFTLTGGAQKGDSTYKAYDALTVETLRDDSEPDYTYKVYNKDRRTQVSGELVPFFDINIKGAVPGIFALTVGYNMNFSHTFKTAYYDRLSLAISITTPVVDINAVLMKRGAFMGEGNIGDMWKDPTSPVVGFAYKFGVHVKTSYAQFYIDYENEFFGKTMVVNYSTQTKNKAGSLSFKLVFGLI